MIYKNTDTPNNLILYSIHDRVLKKCTYSLMLVKCEYDHCIKVRF